MNANGESRRAILDAVRATPMTPVARPDIPSALASRAMPDALLLDRFTEAARAAGAVVVRRVRSRAHELCDIVDVGGRDILSMVTDIPGTRSTPRDARELADLRLFVAEGTLGVAENGAVWLPSTRIGSRAALLLARHVLLLLDADVLVPDLHDAYARIDPSAEPFGLFVAGPSKTADIEQSLVIGAQGPMGLTICLIDQP